MISSLARSCSMGEDFLADDECPPELVADDVAHERVVHIARATQRRRERMAWLPKGPRIYLAGAIGPDVALALDSPAAAQLLADHWGGILAGKPVDSSASAALEPFVQRGEWSSDIMSWIGSFEDFLASAFDIDLEGFEDASGNTISFAE